MTLDCPISCLRADHSQLHRHVRVLPWQPDSTYSYDDPLVFDSLRGRDAACVDIVSHNHA